MKERLISDQYDGYEFAYPEILELSDRQLKDNFWLSTEYDVGLDRLELLCMSVSIIYQMECLTMQSNPA